jgi:hypothetical protein
MINKAFIIKNKTNPHPKRAGKLVPIDYTKVAQKAKVLSLIFNTPHARRIHLLQTISHRMPNFPNLHHFILLLQLIHIADCRST